MSEDTELTPYEQELFAQLARIEEFTTQQIISIVKIS